MLSLVVFLPVVVAAVLAVARGLPPTAARVTWLAATVVDLALLMALASTGTGARAGCWPSSEWTGCPGWV